MKKNLKLISLLFMFLLIISIWDSFYSAPNQALAGEEIENISYEAEQYSNNTFQASLKKLSQVQRDLRKHIVRLTRALKKEFHLRYLIMILLFSFIYGIIHSIGPGHAKSVIFSYFMTVDAKIKDGVCLGVMTAVVHGLSGFLIALFITLGVTQFIENVCPGLNIDNVLSLVSSLFILTLGGCFFIRACIDCKSSRIVCLEERFANKKHTLRNIFLTAIGIGIIPCAGTIILVSFFIAMKRIDLGILSALAMTGGMALIIILAGISSIVSKQATVFICNKKIKVIVLILRFIGSIALILFGLIMF